MSVLLKRSAEKTVPPECIYGCCTEMYGKNVIKIRRTVKRSSNNKFRRELREQGY